MIYRILLLAKAGNTASNIARVMGCSASGVRHTCKTHGIEVK